jgi:hypothetical protein
MVEIKKKKKKIQRCMNTLNWHFLKFEYIFFKSDER